VENIAVIICEVLSQQPAHILKYKSFGTYLADGAGGVREHVTLVLVPAMLASKGERLTRWPTRDILDLALIWLESVFGNVTLDYLPIPSVTRARARISAESLACVMIPLDQAFVLKTRAGCSNRKPAGASK
jgi:hypothetical protein